MIISVNSVFGLLFAVLSVQGLAEDCTFPPSIEGLRYDILDGQERFPRGTIVSYSCDIGYNKASDHSVIRCLGDNNISWEIPSSTCIPKVCGHPGLIPNSDLDGRIWTFMKKIEYTCHKGYVMTSGDSIRFCQANRHWSGQSPTCTIINCTQPRSPEGGNAIYSSVSYKSTVTYECSHRLALIGEKKRQCLENGKWSGSTPRCIEVNCGKPMLEFPTGRATMLHGTKLNDIVEYKCDDGTVEEAMCQNSGQWEPSPPECMYKSKPERKDTYTTTVINVDTEPITDRPQENKKPSYFCKFRPLRWFCLLG